MKTDRRWQGKNWIWPVTRLAIYLRDDFQCLACERKLNDAAPGEITLDHITPRIDGGTHKPVNLYTCCRACNTKRGTMPLHLFVGRDRRAIIKRHARRTLKRYIILARELTKKGKAQ